MEVHVAGAGGLPLGSVLSVKAGQTRRQAPLNLVEGQPLRFPSLPFNAKPFKVEVLAPLGGLAVDLVPGTESYRVPIGEAYINLEVKEAPQHCGKSAAALKAADRNTGGDAAVQSRVAAALSARDYLDDHNLVSVVQEMVHFVIRERPPRPYAFMSAYLGRKSQELDPEPEPCLPEADATEWEAMPPPEGDTVGGKVPPASEGVWEALPQCGEGPALADKGPGSSAIATPAPPEPAATPAPPEPAAQATSTAPAVAPAAAPPDPRPSPSQAAGGRPDAVQGGAEPADGETPVAATRPLESRGVPPSGSTGSLHSKKHVVAAEASQSCGPGAELVAPVMRTRQWLEDPSSGGPQLGRAADAPPKG